MATQTPSPFGRRILTLQTLEPREVPATGITLTGTTFTIDSDDAVAETFQLTRVAGAYQITLMFGTFSAATESLPDIDYDATLKIATLSSAASRSLVFNLGDAGDTLNVGTGTLDPFTNPTNITVAGGAGSDRINVNDADDTAHPYQIGATVLRARDAATQVSVQYSGVEAVSLSTGGEADTIAVTGTAVPTTINAGAGNDTITVGGFDGLVGDLTVNAGAGTNRLSIDDSGAAVPGGDFVLTTNSVARTTGGTRTVTFADVERVTVAAGAGDDQVTLAGALLDDLGANLTLAGDAGSDSLTLDDTAAAAGLTYTVTNAAVSRAGASFGYDAAGFDQLTIAAGSSVDTINVRETKATIPVVIQGGGGPDVINIGNTVNRLTDILGPVTVQGGGTGDQLTILDQGASGAHNYTVGATTVDRSLAATITYGGIGTLRVNASNQADTIRIAGTAVPTIIDAGNGVDTITAGSGGAGSTLDGLAGDVTLLSGGGADELIVDDRGDADAQAYAIHGTAVGRDGRLISFAAEPVSRIALTGGSGNDTVTVGLGDLAALPGQVAVDGGGGSANVLIVDDSGFASGRQLTIDGSTITGGGAADVTYAAFRSLTLNAGTGADTLRVVGDDLPANTAAVINAGPGVDEITVVPVPALPVTNVSIDIDGGGNPGANGDALFVELDSVPDPFGVFIPDPVDPSAGTVAVAGYVTFDYAGIEEVGLDTDAINLTGTAASETLVVSEITDSSMKIRLGGGKVLKVKGDTEVVWTAGSATDTDRIEFQDGPTTQGRDFTVEAGRVVLTGVAPTILHQLRFELVEEILLVTGSGDNVITVNAVPAETTLIVSAGDGNDTVNAPVPVAGSVDLDLGVGDDSVNLAGVAKTVEINGGAGNDTISVGTAAGPTTVLGGTENDSLTVGRAAGDLEVKGGDGNDTITAGTGGLDNWTATATLAGEGGTDRLVVADVGTGTNTYTVTADKISRTSGAVREFPYNPADIEEVELRPADGMNTITVTSTAAGAPVTVVGGGGNDTVVVGNGTLDAIASVVSVAGGTGTDRLEVNDSTKATDQTYTLSATAVVREAILAVPQAAVTVNYSGIGEVVLRAGTEDDSVTVAGNVTGRNTTVLGGSGSDTVAVGTGDLDAVAGSIQVEGGDGADALVVADGGETESRGYEITTAQVKRTGGPGGDATIGFAGVDSLTVTAGTAGDAIAVKATAAATPVTVNAGTGNDTVTVGGNLDDLDGPLTVVSGTDGADKLVVDDSAAPAPGKTYTVNATEAGPAGQTFGYYTLGFRAVELLGGLGDDTITVPETAAGVPVTVGGGGGDDAITVGTGSLDAIVAPVDVTGDADDTVTVNDADDADPATYTFEAGKFTRTDATAAVVTITFDPVGALVLNASAAGADIRVDDTTAPTTVNAGAGNDAVMISKTTEDLTVNGGAGLDTVTAGTGNFLALAGAVSVAGGADDDRLIVNDSGATGSPNYTVGLTEVRRATTAVTFSNVQTIELTTGGADDTVTVPATAALTTVVVNTAAGDDTVRVGGGDVDDLFGTLTLAAGDGAADRLIVDDADEAAANRTYTVTATSVTAAGYSVNYGSAGFERLEVLGGRLDDTATVEGTATGTPVTVNAGLGDDTVYVGTGDLGGLLANVLVSGAGGSADRLEVRDQNSVTPNSYQVTDTFVERGTRRINYTAFEQVSVSAGAAGDAILVASTPTNVPVTVAGGDGSDTVTVRPLDDIGGPLTVVGGTTAADVDVLVADDSAETTGNTYSVDAARVTRTDGSKAIDFAEVDQVTLRTGSGADEVTVREIAGGVTAALVTNDGDDRVTVGAALSLDAIVGPFTLDAGDGSDRLTVDDTADTDPNAYVVTDTAVTRNGDNPVIPYDTADIEALVLRAGQGADTIAVKSTAVGVPVTVNGGAGDDSLSVGDGTLDNLNADVTLEGDDGLDGLLVDDSLDTSDNAYEVTNTTVKRTVVGAPGVQTVNHGDFEALALRAGAGTNVIDVLEMNKDVAILGGSGSDTVTFGSPAAGLAGFAKGIDIAISGGAGADQLILDDEAATADRRYTIDTVAVVATPRALAPAIDDPRFPYTGGFEEVRLLGGDGSDLIVSDAAKGVNLSVDAGGGTNQFWIDYLGGSVFGSADDTFFGRAREIAGLQDGASQFFIDGPNQGTVPARLGGRFVGIGNLVGGGLGDSFTFRTGGSLTGDIRGESGTDEIYGDNAPRTYELTDEAQGKIAVLLDEFFGIESIFGGTADDTLLLSDGVEEEGLSVFDGGAGWDAADFRGWSTPQEIYVTGVGSSGFHLTSTRPPPAELDRHRFKNIDLVYGSLDNTDALVQTTNIPTGWVVPGGAARAYLTEKPLNPVGEAPPAERLEFVGFEKLTGGLGADTFRVHLGELTGTSTLLVSGGISPREIDRQDRLEVLGTDVADTFRMLSRTQRFPTGAGTAVTDTTVAGVELTAAGTERPRLLYDQVRVLDLRGGAGADKFVVEPVTLDGATTPLPLFGVHLRDLVLQGGADNDQFELVPDRYNTRLGKKNFDPQVDYHVFAGAGTYSLVRTPNNGPFKLVGASDPATPPGQDTMILYQLPVRVKANFPLYGRGGPATNRFELTKKLYRRGAVNYYDFFTIVASTKKNAADVKFPPPLP
ncbi:MAG TPA: hypothetical protein VM597_38850 [Gemmataceae bacterium]|nr:hypothetical protein [Gemmataceae bacterium]